MPGTEHGEVRRWTRARVLRVLAMVLAAGLGVAAVWLIVASDTAKQTKVGALLGFWALLLAAYPVLGTRHPQVVGAGSDLDVRVPAMLETTESAAQRLDYERRLLLMIRHEVHGVLGAELASVRAEVAALRNEILEKVGGQIRLERIETTRMIGSDIEALQHEVRQLKVGNQPGAIDGFAADTQAFVDAMSSSVTDRRVVAEPRRVVAAAAHAEPAPAPAPAEPVTAAPAPVAPVTALRQDLADWTVPPLRERTSSAPWPDLPPAESVRAESVRPESMLRESVPSAAVPPAAVPSAAVPPAPVPPAPGVPEQFAPAKAPTPSESRARADVYPGAVVGDPRATPADGPALSPADPFAAMPRIRPFTDFDLDESTRNVETPEPDYPSRRRSTEPAYPSSGRHSGGNPDWPIPSDAGGRRRRHRDGEDSEDILAQIFEREGIEQ